MLELPRDPFEAQLELSFIKKVIADSRRTVALDASPILFWGMLTVVGVVLEYLGCLTGLFFDSLWLWLLLIGIGWAYNLWGWQRRRRRGAHTFADRVLGVLWSGCWAAMTILGFVGYFSGVIVENGITASISVILGLGFYVTGVLVDHPWGRWLGLGWWAVAVLLFFWPGPHVMAVFGMAMMGLQVIPGYLVQRQWKGRHGASLPTTPAGEA